MSTARFTMAMLLAAAVMPAFMASHALADDASPALAKYDKPVDEAVERALAYLAQSQLKDGSFAGANDYGAAIPSLAAMAFLAKGHSPGNGPYGQTICRSIDLVLSLQRPDGYFPSSMYAHSIATLLLSEVSGMVDEARQKKIDQALAKALGLIIAAQKVKKSPQLQGGWRYTPQATDSDISCSGWALMALRSARNAGAPVPREAIDDAIGFVNRCRMSDGGFAYQPNGGSGLARTGTALLCLELAGMHREKVTLDAGEYILKNMPAKFGGGNFYYGLYYSSQGMFQLGGEYWDRYATQMYEMMLKFQRPDGSWPPAEVAAPAYGTAMSVLAMSVTYRQLPIYQR